MSTLTISHSFVAHTDILAEQVTQNFQDIQTWANNLTNLLGYSEATTDGQTITQAGTDITGASVTVTVPSGRSVKITCKAGAYGTAPSYGTMIIKEGSTTLNQQRFFIYENNQTVNSIAIAVVSPSAGSHTYKLTMTASLPNNLTLDSNTGYKAFILAELL